MDFHYNGSDYAAVAFSETHPAITKKKAAFPSGSAATLKKPRDSKDLMERLSRAVSKGKAAGRTINPFLVGFSFDVKKANGDKIETEKLFDANGNEIETRHNFVRNIDTRQFLKLYPELLSRLFDMKAPGKLIFSLVLSELCAADGTDCIVLRHSAKYTFEKHGATRPISRATFYRGRKELIELGIIAEKSGDLFWINPAFIFNGNAVTFAERFIISQERLDSSECE